MFPTRFDTSFISAKPQELLSLSVQTCNFFENWQISKDLMLPNIGGLKYFKFSFNFYGDDFSIFTLAFLFCVLFLFLGRNL
jgi:hypothetical protein